MKETLENLEEMAEERTTQLDTAYNSLKESEGRLAEAQKMAHIGNWVWDIATDKEYWSDELHRIFKRDPQEAAPSYNKYLNYVHLDDRDYVGNAFKGTINGKPYEIDHRIILANGEERTVHIRAEVVFNDKNIPIQTKGIVQDITEHKKAEEKIQNLANIVESSNDAIVTKSLDSIITSWNKGTEAVYGYSAEEMIGKSASILAPPNLADESAKLVELTKQGKKVQHYKTIRLRKDGKLIDVSLNLSPAFDIYGKLTGVSIISRDITESKIAEEKLRESEEKYRNIVETANEGILIIDDEAIVTYANKKMAEMLGYSLEEGIGRPIWNFISEEYKAIVKLNLEKRRRGINENYELKLIHKDGSSLWVLINAKSLFDKDGKFIGSMNMLTDITKRKEAETKLRETLDNLESSVKERTAELERAYKSLKESEKGLAEAQKMAHIRNWDWNIVTNEIYCSDEVYRIFGFNPQEISATYDTFLSYVHPDDLSHINYASIQDSFGRPISIDFRIILATGEERTVHAQTEVIFAEENNPVRIKGIIKDITERKKAEKALELSEERYRIITEQTGQLVYDYDVEEDAADWAGDIRELTGFTPDEFRSTSLGFWLSRIHPEDQNILLEKYSKSLVSGETYRMEYRFRKKNGEYIYFEDNGIFLRDRKGNSNRVLGVVKDITERKKAEIFVANIETARKKEIHHRIKNNLQVISSLLDLQAEKFRDRVCVEDSEVLKAFRESQDRVTSIALIHEELHEGKGTDALNFSPYLERLVKNLFQTYRLGNASTSLNIELEENIFFDMDIAVPLGIIINELVSNSLKYAFPGKDKGLIQIKLCREKEGRNGTNFILTVSDNGIGIPESFNSENSSSLGLQLVMILVDQLGGELELKRDSGTEFVIRFSVAERQ